MTDAQLIDNAVTELDNAERALDAIATTHPAHAAMIGEALKAIHRADSLLSRVKLEAGSFEALGDALRDMLGGAVAEINLARIQGRAHTIDLEALVLAASRRCSDACITLAQAVCAEHCPEPNFIM